MKRNRSSKGRRKKDPAREQRNMKFALVLIAFLSAVFLLFTSLLGDKSLFQLHRMERARKGWGRENVALVKENRRLREKIRAARHDPFVVEKIAREELGMVRKDDIVYLFNSPRIRNADDLPSLKTDVMP